MDALDRRRRDRLHEINAVFVNCGVSAIDLLHHLQCIKAKGTREEIECIENNKGRTRALGKLCLVLPGHTNWYDQLLKGLAEAGAKDIVELMKKDAKGSLLSPAKPAPVHHQTPPHTQWQSYNGDGVATQGYSLRETTYTLNTHVKDLSVGARNVLSRMDISEPPSKNWQDLAAYFNISWEDSQWLQKSHNPSAQVVEMWSEKYPTHATLANLLHALQTLERYDVIADMEVALGWVKEEGYSETAVPSITSVRRDAERFRRSISKPHSYNNNLESSDAQYGHDPAVRRKNRDEKPTTHYNQRGGTSFSGEDRGEKPSSRYDQRGGTPFSGEDKEEILPHHSGRVPIYERDQFQAFSKFRDTPGFCDKSDGPSTKRKSREIQDVNSSHLPRHDNRNYRAEPRGGFEDILPPPKTTSKMNNKGGALESGLGKGNPMMVEVLYPRPVAPGERIGDSHQSFQHFGHWEIVSPKEGGTHRRGDDKKDNRQQQWSTEDQKRAGVLSNGNRVPRLVDIGGCSNYDDHSPTKSARSGGKETSLVSRNGPSGPLTPQKDINFNSPENGGKAMRSPELGMAGEIMKSSQEQDMQLQQSPDTRTSYKYPEVTNELGRTTGNGTAGISREQGIGAEQSPNRFDTRTTNSSPEEQSKSCARTAAESVRVNQVMQQDSGPEERPNISPSAEDRLDTRTTNNSPEGPPVACQEVECRADKGPPNVSSVPARIRIAYPSGSIVRKDDDISPHPFQPLTELQVADNLEEVSIEMSEESVLSGSVHQETTARVKDDSGGKGDKDLKKEGDDRAEGVDLPAAETLPVDGRDVEDKKSKDVHGKMVPSRIERGSDRSCANPPGDTNPVAQGDSRFGMTGYSQAGPEAKYPVNKGLITKDFTMIQNVNSETHLVDNTRHLQEKDPKHRVEISGPNQVGPGAKNSVNSGLITKDFTKIENDCTESDPTVIEGALDVRAKGPQPPVTVVGQRQSQTEAQPNLPDKNKTGLITEDFTIIPRDDKVRKILPKENAGEDHLGHVKSPVNTEMGLITNDHTKIQNVHSQESQEDGQPKQGMKPVEKEWFPGHKEGEVGTGYSKIWGKGSAKVAHDPHTAADIRYDADSKEGLGKVGGSTGEHNTKNGAESEQVESSGVQSGLGTSKNVFEQSPGHMKHDGFHSDTPKSLRGISYQSADNKTAKNVEAPKQQETANSLEPLALMGGAKTSGGPLVNENGRQVQTPAGHGGRSIELYFTNKGEETVMEGDPEKCGTQPIGTAPVTQGDPVHLSTPEEDEKWDQAGKEAWRTVNGLQIPTKVISPHLFEMNATVSGDGQTPGVGTEIHKDSSGSKKAQVATRSDTGMGVTEVPTLEPSTGETLDVFTKEGDPQKIIDAKLPDETAGVSSSDSGPKPLRSQEDGRTQSEGWSSKVSGVVSSFVRAWSDPTRF